MREVKVNKLYKHFKGNIYKVLYIAQDTETLNKVVVYQDTTDLSKIWVRDYDMFVSIVDKDKYPDCICTYRFEEYDN